MIIHDVEQGSPEWLQLRLGIPTASEFDKILTPKTMKPSASARPYMFRLAAEKLLNRQLDSIDHLEHIAHGKEWEADAVSAYELINEVEAVKVGFITSDDGLVGASPDRLLKGSAGGLEVKCPAPWTQMGYFFDGFGDEYRCQVQGQMLVCGLDFVDRWAWHPELPPRLDRTGRDEKFIAALAVELEKFNEELARMIERARGSGFFADRVAKIITAHEEAYAAEEEG